VQIVIAHQPPQLPRQIARVPHVERQPSATPPDLDHLGHPAVVGHQHGRAVAHGLRGNEPERLAVDGGIDDAAAVGVERIAHLIGHAAAVVGPQAQVLGHLHKHVAVSLAETRAAADDQVEIDPLLAQHLHRVQQQVDALL